MCSEQSVNPGCRALKSEPTLLPLFCISFGMRSLRTRARTCCFRSRTPEAENPASCESRSTALPDRRQDKLRTTSLTAPHAVSPEGRRVLPHRTARPRRIAIPAPVLRSRVACSRRLQSGSRRLQILVHQPDRRQCRSRQSVRTAENVSIAQALVAGARDRRTIRDNVPRY